MYRCKDCGAIFDEPAYIKEDRGECFGFPAYEEMAVCPRCKGDDYERMPEDEEEEWA